MFCIKYYNYISIYIYTTKKNAVSSAARVSAGHGSANFASRSSDHLRAGVPPSIPSHPTPPLTTRQHAVRPLVPPHRDGTGLAVAEERQGQGRLRLRLLWSRCSGLMSDDTLAAT